MAYYIQLNGENTSSAVPPTPVPSVIHPPRQFYPVPSISMLNDANYLSLAPSAVKAPIPSESSSNSYNYTEYLPAAVIGDSSVLHGLFGIGGENGGGGGAGGGDDGGGGYGGGRGSLSPFESLLWWKVEQEKVFDEVEVAQARSDARMANWEIFVEDVEPTDEDISRNLQLMEHVKFLNQMFVHKLPGCEIENDWEDSNETKAEGKNPLISA